MNDKQQLAAMGEHMAEQAAQPLCTAKRIEELEAQVRVMAELLREARPYMDHRGGAGVKGYTKLTRDIDVALAGNLPEQHPDDAAVDRFAAAMKAKLAAAREKGRGGWDDPEACSVEFLADLLVGHIGKGNPGNFEDIANLAMMLHQRGADPAVLAGHAPVPDAPEGWQLVPVVPTTEMVEAYFAGKMEAQSCTHQQRARERVARDYRAMLAAAKSPDSTK